MSAKTHCFVALYAGGSIATARLISASADAGLVHLVAEYLLQGEQPQIEANVPAQAVREGNRKALSLILEGKE